MVPHKILIVEDEPDIREILTTFLKRRGHDVKQANTCAEGLRIMQCEHPHLLLTDKRLPDNLGYELIRKAQALQACLQPRTVLMTGDHAVDMRENPCWPDAVLRKPFALLELAKVVDKLLG